MTTTTDYRDESLLVYLQGEAIGLEAADPGGPDEADLRLEVVRIERYAGSRTDRAVLALRRFDAELAAGDAEGPTIPGSPQVLRNPDFVGQYVEVRRRTDDEPDGPGEIVFFGVISGCETNLGRGFDQTLIATHPDWLLSENPIRSVPTIRAPFDSGNEHSGVDDRGIVFNPLIDGQIIGNMKKLDDEEGTPIWLDPEATRTPSAREFNQVDEIELWTIDLAVRGVCLVANDDETFFLNPRFFEQSDGPDFLNVELRRGAPLCQHLDAILTPHGYGWYLHSFDVNGSNQKGAISIFRIGEGDHRTVKYQQIEIHSGAPHGNAPDVETLDLGKHDVAELSYSTSTHATPSKVVIEGSLVEVEAQYPVRPGWQTSEDDLAPDELALDLEPYAEHPNAWRLWVANEAGDHSGKRDGDGPPSNFIGPDGLQRGASRRRPIGDTLTLDAQGRRIPPTAFIFYDRDYRDPREWGATPTFLADQCGFYFGGHVPPLQQQEAVKFYDPGYVVLFGTLVMDERLVGTRNHFELDGEAVATSPQTNPNFSVVIDASDRFHHRFSVVLESSRILDGPLDEVDDRERIEEYAGEVYRNVAVADTRASLRLHGMNWDYAIGDLITHVEGLGWSLAMNLTENTPEAAHRFPQVVGIVWDQQQQLTELILSQDAF